MTIIAPEISYTIPPVYHRHIWRVRIHAGTVLLSDATIDELLDAIYAECEDCNEKMDRAGIEAILNGERFLTDE